MHAVTYILVLRVHAVRLMEPLFYVLRGELSAGAMC